jgi:GntR family transcriptional repressor for pyruvate dehydrogenase complex
MKTPVNISLNRETLPEQVASQIEEMILNESRVPDDKLPSERELSARMGVSRNVVREATRVLLSRGLVEIRPGNGTYIRALSSSDASKPIGRLLRLRSGNTFGRLHEVRGTLEVEIAGLAAERATPEDIQRLEQALEGQQLNSDDPEKFTRFDLEFHSALAAATHNELYSLLLEPITDLLLEFRLAAYEFDKHHAVEGGLNHHQLLLDTVRAGDAEEARQVMRDHLNQTKMLYLSSQEDGLKKEDTNI